MAARYRTAFKKLVPAWLADDVLYSLAVMKDAFAERVRQGLYARWPSYAPPSALPYLARDRRIVRGINEPTSSFRVRLRRWLRDHRVRGNPFALAAQLRAYCNADVRIRIVDRRGNWYTIDRDGSLSWQLNQANWSWDDGGLDRWARFWVIMYPTSSGQPWSVATSPYAGKGQTIGTTATPDQVATVRAIIRDWKPAGTRCEWVIVAFDDLSFDPSAPEPDGAWKHWGKDNAGNYEPARLNTARYWRGVDGMAPS